MNEPELSASPQAAASSPAGALKTAFAIKVFGVGGAGCNAVAHLARYLPWKPEVVHGHDWQTGVVPLLIRHQAAREGWAAPPRTCLTIHNLAYQGLFAAGKYDLLNLPADYFNPEGAEFHGMLNCLKTGIVFADVLATVSPRYAREITTELLGCGLDGVLRRRQSDFRGILNGVDYEEWNTEQNPFLQHPYSLRRLAGKAAGKAALQSELGLPVAPRTPLFSSIMRLTEQKGVDIQLAALEEMLATDLQFVLLGSGAPFYEQAYRRLARRFPSQVAVRIGFDQALSHRIEAGSDFFLMPSRFEPCGLNQMYSQRYGTVPIVRQTGGLADSVVDLSENLAHATGIKFHGYSPSALAKAIRKAWELYRTPKLHRLMQRNGMTADFGWDRTARAYLDLYRGSDRSPRVVRPSSQSFGAARRVPRSPATRPGPPRTRRPSRSAPPDPPASAGRARSSGRRRA